jgi:hypothetical protein
MALMMGRAESAVITATFPRAFARKPEMSAWSRVLMACIFQIVVSMAHSF